MTLHCSLYNSVSITRRHLCQRLSSFRLFLFSRSMSSLYQAAAGLTVIIRFFYGARISSTLASSVSYLSTSVGRSVMVSCKTVESFKSLRRAFISIELSLRYLISCCSARGFVSYNVQCTAKWSDSVGSLTTILSTRLSADRVMIRSRVCALEWVGVATCCFRLKDPSRL